MHIHLPSLPFLLHYHELLHDNESVQEGRKEKHNPEIPCGPDDVTCAYFGPVNHQCNTRCAHLCARAF